MRIKITIILLLALTIYTMDTAQRFEVEELPKSKPTPVEQFMRKVAKIESNGNYKVVNKYGMMGKYQFSPSTVNMLGFRVSQQEFLRDPVLQDTVMYKYMMINYKNLKDLIDRYDGTTRHGIKITRAGILAGAHFAGSGNVRLYLLSSAPDDISDGNGTTIRHYMSQFSEFSLPPLTM